MGHDARPGSQTAARETRSWISGSGRLLVTNTALDLRMDKKTLTVMILFAYAM